MSRAIPMTYGLAGGSKYGQYYRHSGQINLGGLLAALVVGIGVGVVMGAAYSAAVVFIPFVKLRAIACFGYGCLLGVAPAKLLKKLKVRNVPVSMAIVAFITLVSYYICWGSWEAMVLRNLDQAPSAVRILTHPRIVYNIAVAAFEDGTWSLSGSAYDQNNSNDDAVKGTFLLVIWGLEAAIIFGCALLTSRSLLSMEPFCEKCNQWCGGAKTLRLSAPTDAGTLKSKLETGDFAFIATLPNPTGTGVFTYTQHQCSKCKDLSTLSVISRTLRKDRRGRVRSTRPKTIVNKLLVSSEDMQKIVPADPTAPAAAVPKPPEQQARKPMKSPQSLV